MPSSIPKKVRIGHMIYNVALDTNLKNDRGQSLYGCVTKGKALIKIDKEIDVQVQRETLVHEIVHAILFDFPEEISSDMNEKLCVYLGVRLKELIEDNPKMLDFING